MRTRAVIIVFLCAAVAVPAFTQMKADVGPEEKAVLGLELAWNQAELHHDTRAIDAMMAPRFMRVNDRGRLMNKTEYLAEIANRSMSPTQITNEDVKIERYGDTAVVVSTYRETGTDKGKKFTIRGRFTDIWTKVNGGWLCVANQETLIQ